MGMLLAMPLAYCYRQPDLRAWTESMQCCLPHSFLRIAWTSCCYCGPSSSRKICRTIPDPCGYSQCCSPLYLPCAYKCHLAQHIQWLCANMFCYAIGRGAIFYNSSEGYATAFFHNTRYFDVGSYYFYCHR